MGTFLWRLVLSVLLLITGLIQVCLCSSSNSSSGWCFETERLALLKFKHSFEEDPSGRLSSWQGNHCCQWEGVGCDDNTGHVTMLNLRNTEAIQVIEDYWISIHQLRARELNSSLVELQHLSYLDIGGNDFQGSNIPGFLGSMKRLRFLGLYDARFSGSIPGELGNLSSLQHLKLGARYWGQGLYADNFQWASNLLSLKYLDMSWVNMTKVASTMKVLATLPSLTNLTLSGCYLQNIEFDHTSSSSVNSTFFTSLEHLDLSYNHHLNQQSLMSVLRNMTSLKILDLSGNNNFNSSSAPSYFLRDLKKLVHLDLSFNSFNSFGEGGLMSMLDGFCSLKSLDLSYNKIKSLELENNNNYNTSSHCANYDLEFLSLESNEISGPLCGWLEKLEKLKELDLSYNYFYGPFPPSFEKLTSLTSLLVANNDLNGPIPELSCSLKHLDLSGNYFYGPFPPSFEKLTSLTSLLVANNDLNGTIPELSCSLKHLDLSSNYFYGHFPSSFGKLKSLTSLNVANNHLNGTIPELSCSLKHLDLSYNSFYGHFPSSFGKLTSLTSLNVANNHLNGTIPELSSRLRHLDLSYNSFYGPFAQSFEKLTSLTYLNVANNNLNGKIPDYFGKLLSLEVLILNGNLLVGTIPDSIGDLLILTNLGLSDNKLTGDVPESLGNLNRLVNLDVSSNSLQGIVSEAHFANLSNLETLSIGSNNLSCKMRSDWIPPFSLLTVHMAGCKFGTGFPEWLRTQNGLTALNLSNADIVATFPIWLQDMPLGSLDLSTNQISGPIHSYFDSATALSFLQDLILGSNLISGSIPNQLCKLDQLLFLDLSRNMLSGEIPGCLGEDNDLVLVNLSDNELSGTIPNSIGNMSGLIWFHINNNSLSGELPLSLGNCTELRVVDLGGNQFSGAIPDWIGNSILNLKVLRLRDNKFSGNIPKELCILSKLHILDLANNHLVGEIPRCFNNLTGMTVVSDVEWFNGSTTFDEQKVLVVMKGRELEYTTTLRFLNNIDLSCNNLQGFIPRELFALFGLKGLNLSYNHLSGNISNQIGNLKSLESLDLSNNKLFGQIPSTLSMLTMLAHLNLSNNDLSGRIPTGNQLQTLDVDPSIYAGNTQLCGNTLPRKCSDDHRNDGDSTSHEKEKEEEEEEDKVERIWLYLAISLGYATGIGVVVMTLCLKRKWRITYFRFAENAKDRLIVITSVKMTKLKRMINKADGE